MASPVQVCLELARSRLPPSSLRWWDETLLVLGGPFTYRIFGMAFSRASRMVGVSSVELSKDDRTSLLKSGISLIDNQPAHELARIALLLHGITQIPYERRDEFIHNLFLGGDTAERIALLRALSFFPNPCQFLGTAVEACRSNVQPVFEAIACENVYPASHFPELNYNQLVMKALFLGLSLHRIVSLSERITPALRRMVGDHILERTAAGRPVHEDTTAIQND